MQRPLQIAYRDMESSPALESDVRARAEQLERFYDNIIGCHVTIEQHHRHHRQGNLFQIHIEVDVPGSTVVVSRDRDAKHAHEDVYVALRDAFKAARRQLEDHARRDRGRVKAHEVPAHGRIVEHNPKEDFGRIETPEGRLVYFHRNSVVNAEFDRLATGLEVRFEERAGEHGPQASTVRVLGKHHIVG